MSNRRPPNWSAALRELKADRLTRQPVREERLRTAQGLRGSLALALSGWRGISGRRYVVGVHPLDRFEAADADEAVVLFVARDREGIASLICGACDLDAIGAAWLMERATALGATEAHVHRLAEDEAERTAILADLSVPVLEAA